MPETSNHPDSSVLRNVTLHNSLAVIFCRHAAAST
jgi:hypothetical protein